MSEREARMGGEREPCPECRDAALEEAAQMAEKLGTSRGIWSPERGTRERVDREAFVLHAMGTRAHLIAKAIRMLKSPAPAQEETR